ncbi:MAG: LamG domain-containing protein, partial [Desulfobacterales bacterium]|nr:LamG domain-containing protein [Desulfobacterales bacterium]
MNKVKKGLFVIILIGTLLSIGGFAHASLTDGLVAYYPFNGNANDESGNGNNGTVNGATLTTDRNGNANSAFSFNGSGNIISIDSNPSLNPTSSLTLVCWVYPLMYNTNGTGIITKNDQYILGINWPQGGNTQELNLWLYKQGWSLYALGKVPLNSWSYVAAVYNGNTASLYINGMLIGTHNGTLITGTQTTASQINTTTNKLIIGTGNASTSQYFKGTIDNIRIYNRALSESEIQQLYNENSQPVDEFAIPDQALRACIIEHLKKNPEDKITKADA